MEDGHFGSYSTTFLEWSKAGLAFAIGMFILSPLFYLLGMGSETPRLVGFGMIFASWGYVGYFIEGIMEGRFRSKGR